MSEDEYIDKVINNDMTLLLSKAQEQYLRILRMTFKKSESNIGYVNLQNNIIELVTLVIIKHEEEFYHLIEKFFNDRKKNILGTSSSIITQMISKTTNKFFSKVFFDIQNKKKSDLVNYILNICKLTDYGSHILLDKLIKFTISLHTNIKRENLNLDNLDKYKEDVLKEININLKLFDITQIFSKGSDDIDFIPTSSF